MTIKKDFYFFWFGGYPHGMPFLHYLSLKSCLLKNNPDSTTLVCDQRPQGLYWDELKHQVTVRLVEPDSRFTNQNNSNLQRFQVLKDFGGVYSDLDMLFVNPLPDELFQESFVASGKQYLGGFDCCDAFMMAEKNSTLLDLWTRSVTHKVETGQNATEETIAGSIRVGDHFRTEEHDCLILPEKALYSVSPLPMSVIHFLERREVDTEGVYAFHLWGHLVRRLRLNIEANVQQEDSFFARYANKIIEATI